MAHTSSGPRKLCGLPPPTASPSGPTFVNVLAHGNTVNFGVATREESEKLVSSSFKSILVEYLPLQSCKAEDTNFGGHWFWEGYRHGLVGENVIFHLGGTGIDLWHDSLECQVKARGKLVAAAPERAALSALAHSACRLEAILAIAMSVVMHVAQQPLLDANEGPQAVFLCATKDQCDELASVLRRFCDELHFVVHNLFDPYPSIPSTKRAEVVIGSPPLWESVAPLGDLSSQSDDEALLRQITGEDAGPTYSRTRWRPYQFDRVSQLVIFDIELQMECGFGQALRRWLVPTDTVGGSPVRRGAAEALPSRQIYVVSRDRGDIPSVSADRLHGERQSLLSAVEGLGRDSGFGTAVLRVARGYPLIPHKRPRTDDGDSAAAGVSLTTGLMVRHAVSYAKLIADPALTHDFESGLMEQCDAFWAGFEGTASVGTEKMREYVEVRVGFVCDREARLDDASAALVETVVLILPTTIALQTQPSRTALLMRHMAERLTGAIFDGCALWCAEIKEMGDELPDLWSLAAHISMPCMGEAEPGNKPPVVVYAPGSHCKESNNSSVSHLATDRSAAFSGSEGGPRLAAQEPLERLPTYSALTNALPPADPFTVLVLRHLGRSVADLCAPPVSGAASARQARKPFVLYLLEECCQYGKVLSYYCHESTLTKTASPTPSVHSLANDDKDCKSPLPDQTTTTTTAALFVEFRYESSALEAVRIFADRYATMSPVSCEPRKPTAHLMRNMTYYAGVRQATNPSSSSDSDSDSSLFAAVSLLDE